MRTPAAWAVIGLLGALSAGAQVRSNSATLEGAVFDSNAMPVDGAVVQLWDSAKGFLYETRSASDGMFRLSVLPPGRYRLEASKEGFSRTVFEDVDLAIDETVKIDVRLSFEPVTFQIAVNARLPEIDYQRTQQASAITQERLRNIALNRRDYLGLALLAPGVVETTTVVDQADLRPLAAPASNLAVAGANGRTTLVQIDGGSVSATGGFVRGDLPQVSVQEFQVNRNSYSAEMGGVTGAVLNIVSRSGTNDYHGGAFAFLRHRDIQARNFFDPGKSGFTRVQSGAQFGGPLVQDRTFFYSALERLDRQETVFVPLHQERSALGLLTPSQRALTEFLESSGVPEFGALAGTMSAILTPANNPQVGALLDTNSGTFPFSAHRTTASLRLDHYISERHRLFFRANLKRSEDTNSGFGGLRGLTNGSAGEVDNETLLLNHTWLLAPNWTSVTRLSYGRSHFVQSPNDLFGPELVISGVGTFGRNNLFPQDSTERYGQLQQSFEMLRGAHTLHFGTDINVVRSQFDIPLYFGGQFVFGEFIPLGLFLNGATGSADFADNLGQTLSGLGRADLAASLAAPLSSLQAFSLGLPAAYIQGFGDSKYSAWRPSSAFFLEDSWRVKTGLTLSLGLRYHFDQPPDVRHSHTFAPRFGFVWAPWRERSTVIRGGYGIFQAFMLGNIAYLQRQFNRPDVTLLFLSLAGAPGVNNPVTGLPLTSADIYQSLAAQGVLGQRQIQRDDLATLGIPPEFRFPTAGGVQRDYTNPYSQQASLEIEHEIAGVAVSAGAEVHRELHGWRTRDHNLAQIGTRPDGWPIFGRADPAIANNYISESAANSFYHAFFVQVNKRFRRYWGLNAHYTISRATNEVTDFTIEYMPHNQFDARADRGLSLFHQKHRLVLSAVFESPQTGHPLVRNWILAPVVRANSFRPFNIATGFDNLGDGQTATHRPLGLGRNVGIGPSYFSADVRVTRSFAFAQEGRVQLQFIAEGFNLANRTNFQSVNNIVGAVPLEGLPQPLKGGRGNPSRPLSFTAAHNPRQFQLGLRLLF